MELVWDAAVVTVELHVLHSHLLFWKTLEVYFILEYADIEVLLPKY